MGVWGSFKQEVSAIATPQIEAVIERLATDQAFRTQYCKDPDTTLRMYHLTPEEIYAIKSGDDGLSQLIADEKWETLIHALCGPLPGP
jgi:hypothetical protein